MFRCAAVLIVIAIPAWADEKKPAPKTDADALKGTWEIVSTTYDGMEVPSKGRTLVFGDKEFTAFVGEKQGRTIAFKLDSTTDPKQIDLDRGSTVKMAKGIYSIDKDELKLCYGEPGAERPQTFESKAGRKVFLLILKRAKG